MAGVDVKSSVLLNNLGQYCTSRLHLANKNAWKFKCEVSGGDANARVLCFLEPHFLHAVEYGDYVYFFYREIAAEHNNLGKVRLAPHWAQQHREKWGC